MLHNEPYTMLYVPHMSNTFNCILTVLLSGKYRCPINNQNLRIQTRACHGWSRCNGICLVAGPDTVYANKATTKSVPTPAMPGLVFYVEIQIILGQCGGV